MFSRIRGLSAVVLAAAGVSACSSGADTRQLARDAATAMGGIDQLRAIRTITMSGGAGTRTRLGQTVRAGEPENVGQLRDVVEIVDLANNRASMHYVLTNGAFVQERHEIVAKRGNSRVGIEIIPNRPIVASSVAGLFSWGTQNSPEFLLRRNLVGIMLAAAETGSEQPASDRELNGRMHKYGNVLTRSGDEIGLFFDPESKLLAGFETTDTETMLGDVRAQYLLGDYRSVGNVALPHQITIRKDGQDYSSVQFTAMSINDSAVEAALAIPEEASAEADRAIAAGEYSRVALTQVAGGVYFARAYSHNSLVVEFPAWMAVVEAPYTEAQSTTLARVIGEQFPGKPIRYAAVTHHHYDHTGGVRGIAARGATILVAQGHEAPLRALLDASHTNPPDELSRRRAAKEATGSIEVYADRQVVSDGGQRLELYAVTGSPHVDPIVLAYVPSARVLFQSDVWFPGTGGAGNPAARHLLQSVKTLGLAVDTNVGGHGGVAPFSELTAAVAKMGD
jgi:glyoxylase-like metal-dependent hydrolase (beta-lactamase superfamily II)